VFAFSPRRNRAKPGRRSSFLVGALGSLTLAGVLSASATAPALAASGTCPAATLLQPFTKWGDSNSYSLVSQGDFEGSVSEWTLTGGAKQAAGSESYGVSGKVGTYSMLLPQGATARSPFMCVTEVDRTFRFFDRSEGSTSTLRVDLIYKTVLGSLVVKATGLTAGATWQPTAAVHTGAPLATELTNGTAQLALRFTSVSGSGRIDDVYLDPRRR
jgi:hypothetical protein